MNTELIAKNILDIEGVVGIGSSPTIKIFVESEDYIDAVAKIIHGKKVDVYVTGRVRALDRVRPVVGGVSVGNPKITAGTLGIVHNGLIISNAHVLAMDENGNFLDHAENWQPGPLDGGSEYDVIGYLLSYIPIDFNSLTADNRVDIAIGKMIEDYVNDTLLINDSLVKIDFSPIDLKEGDMVFKVGRTTGLTKGIVVSESASVKVFYTEDKWAVFHDVYVIKGMDGAFMRGGDSGSIIFKDKRFAGLGYAGNPDTGFAFANKPKYVLAALRGKAEHSYIVPIVALTSIPIMFMVAKKLAHAQHLSYA